MGLLWNPRSCSTEIVEVGDIKPTVDELPTHLLQGEVSARRMRRLWLTDKTKNRPRKIRSHTVRTRRSQESSDQNSIYFRTTPRIHYKIMVGWVTGLWRTVTVTFAAGRLTRRKGYIRGMGQIKSNLKGIDVRVLTDFSIWELWMTGDERWNYH